MTVLSNRPTGSTPDAGTAAASGETFDSLAPATSERLATYPVASEQDVRAAVDRSRTAFDTWGSLSFDERRRHLVAWRARIAREGDDLAAVVSAETGKPRVDAVSEVLLAIDHLDWASKNARKVLGPRKVSAGALAPNHEAVVEYPPLGVVGVIGPWNYPVFTPMGSIAYALAAGNTVVFKPSEYTPGVGVWLAKAFAAAVTIPDVFQTVTGLGATGAALCTAPIGKLAFTGSSATGRKVM